MGNDVSRNFYNLAGELAVARSPLGYEEHYAYSNRGFETSTTDARNNAWANTFDAAGNPLTGMDPQSHGVTWTIDNLNRQSTATDALTNVVSQTFWNDGREKDFTDARG